jgi:hypothetical protein
VTLGLGVFAAAGLLAHRRRWPPALAVDEHEAQPVTPPPYDRELEDALSR